MTKTMGSIMPKSRGLPVPAMPYVCVDIGTEKHAVIDVCFVLGHVTRMEEEFS